MAGLAKVAAASVDDVAAYAGKAGAKAAGAVIDDAAVTPKYVHGFEASRELPIIWRITRIAAQQLLFLLPAALLLSSFAPWLIAPLLMLGGDTCVSKGRRRSFMRSAHAAHPAGAEDDPRRSRPPWRNRRRRARSRPISSCRPRS